MPRFPPNLQFGVRGSGLHTVEVWCLTAARGLAAHRSPALYPQKKDRGSEGLKTDFQGLKVDELGQSDLLEPMGGVTMSRTTHPAWSRSLPCFRRSVLWSQPKTESLDILFYKKVIRPLPSRVRSLSSSPLWLQCERFPSSPSLRSSLRPPPPRMAITWFRISPRYTSFTPRTRFNGRH